MAAQQPDAAALRRISIEKTAADLRAVTAREAQELRALQAQHDAIIAEENLRHTHPAPFTPPSSRSIPRAPLPQTDRCGWCGDPGAPLRGDTPDGGRYLCDRCHAVWLADHPFTETPAWKAAPTTRASDLTQWDPFAKMANGHSMAEVADAIKAAYDAGPDYSTAATTDLFEELRDRVSPGWRTRTGKLA